MDNNKGFVKLHRKMFEWEWWDDINTFRLFVTLLLMVNWTEKKWRGRVIPRGSCWTSIEALAKKSGLTFQQTRTALDKLILTNEITSEVTNEGRLITVVKYDVYQFDAENVTSEITNETDDEQQTSNKRINKRVTTTKEVIRSNNKFKEVIEQQQDGRSIEIDLNEMLSVDEITTLSRKYRDVNKLLDEVETDIIVKGKSVRYPFRYVDGYAKNKNWPRKESE